MECRLGKEASTVENRLEGLGAKACEFFAYWDGLPKHGLIPRRSDLDPVALKTLLADLVICKYEFDGEGALVFRLVGTNHEQRWGRSLTGLNYLDLVPRERRALAWARQRLIVEHPCGTHSFRVETFATGRSVRLESTTLPLRGPDGAADMLVSLSAEAPDRKTAAWQLGPGQSITDSQLGRFIDIGNGEPRDPAAA